MADSRTPGKRSACDRCRTRKLRCLRVEEHPISSCVRCVRSKVECITSSSKRPGRPTSNHTNTSRQHTDPTPNTCNEVNASLHAVDILANIDDLFNLRSLNANYETSSACWTPDVYPHDVPIGGGSGPTMSPLSAPTNGTSNPASLNELKETTMSKRFHNRQSEQGHNGIPQLFDHQHSAQGYDHGLRLSVLYRDLSRQLFTLKSNPWNVTDVMRLTCIHDTSHNSTKAFQANVESNPLASIAKISAEFAELLWSFQTPMLSGGIDTPMNAGSPSSAHPRLRITDLLTTVSCHILIISIYDSIFCHFMDQSLHNPAAVNIVMQSAPKLFLGGIAVSPQPDMLGHLLVCLTENQLRPIELLLGLPDEFCVSLKDKDSRNGLFSGQSGQSLFTTLMQIETEGMIEERGNLGVIKSLKDKTRRVQGRK